MNIGHAAHVLAAVTKTDLALVCSTCDYIEVTRDTAADEWLIRQGDTHHNLHPDHDLDLGALVDFDWKWTETGEVLNGYEIAQRLLAKYASMQ